MAWSMRAGSRYVEFGDAMSGLGLMEHPVVSVDAGAEMFENPRGDGRRPGQDFIAGQVVSLLVEARPDHRPLDEVWRELAAVWRGDEVRTRGGALATLTADSGRSVFGRPRPLSPDMQYRLYDTARAELVFEAVDDLWYGPEQVTEISFVPPVRVRTYEWVGVANASASVERVEGVETRRNRATNPLIPTNSGYSGSRVGVLSASGGAISGSVIEVGYLPRISVPRVPGVAPGDVVDVSVEVGATAIVPHRVRLVFLNPSGAQVGLENLGPESSTGRISVQATAPVGAVNYSVEVAVPSNSALGTVITFGKPLIEVNGPGGAFFHGSMPPSGVGLRIPAEVPFVLGAGSGVSEYMVTVGGDVATQPVFELHGPILDPFIEVVGVGRLIFRGQLAYDQTLTVDTRHWARWVKRDGAAFPGALSPSGSRLSDMSLMPGAYQVFFGGYDPTGTSSLDVRVRPAFTSF